MVRVVNADEIRKKAVPHTRGDYGYSADIRKWAVLVGDIDDAPTIDAVLVVRCKDCKHYVDRKEISKKCCYVHLLTPHPMPEDGFCSYGERKDGDA